MDIFMQRKTAVAIFVLVAVLFSLIGFHLSFGRACGRIEAAFFGAARGEPLAEYGCYTSPGEQLAECVKYANRLLSAINGSDDLAEGYAAVRDSRQALADALEAEDIPAAYDASAALYTAVSGVDALVKAGAALPPSSDDYNAIVADFFSAQRVAAQSPYNEYVDAFIRDTATPFPAGILRRLSFAGLPEKFE